MGQTFAMLGLFTAATQDLRVIQACGGDMQKGTQANIKLVEDVMMIVKPVCCYLNKARPNVAEKIVWHALRGEVWPKPPTHE